MADTTLAAQLGDVVLGPQGAGLQDSVLAPTPDQLLLLLSAGSGWHCRCNIGHFTS
jgi:hypothetical protein